MASASEASHKQRAVIEFLPAEEETAGNIHKRLKSVYGVCTVDRNTNGRWVKRVRSSESGNANLDDEPPSGKQGITGPCFQVAESLRKIWRYVEK
jgi:hypothetical protein